MKDWLARMLGSPAAWFRYHRDRADYHTDRAAWWRKKLPPKFCGLRARRVKGAGTEPVAVEGKVSSKEIRR